jgi:hypothetical protein
MNRLLEVDQIGAEGEMRGDKIIHESKVVTVPLVRLSYLN